MKSSRLNACNVLSVSDDVAQLWQFSAAGGDIQLVTEQIGKPDSPLPARLVAKDWRSLFQKKINLAWLPPHQVFLRVVHLPTNDPKEVPAMLELQLEKLSPLPVAQVVWSYELLTAADSNLQPVIVLIAARNPVEDFLGRLEGQGYLADRLDFPFLHELQVTKFDRDGVWIYARTVDGNNLCLAAWHYGGLLQSVSLLRAPSDGHWDQALREELTRAAWAGEVEGWLNSAPRFTLVGDATASARWESILRELTAEPIEQLTGLKAQDLAALNASRIADPEGKANLLPPEFVAKYKQQFIDRLWMRGLGALGIIYLLGVVIYFGALQVIKYRSDQVGTQVTGMSGSFTNALKLKARVQVLQEQSNLRFAALDCWKAVTEALAPELTLTSMTFQRGKTVSLTGTASDASQVTDYMEALNKSTANGTMLFAKVNLRNSHTGSTPRGPQTIWNIECELQRQEAP